MRIQFNGSHSAWLYATLAVARTRVDAYRRKRQWARRRRRANRSTTMTSAVRWLVPAAALALAAPILASVLASSSAVAQECRSRGQLDTLYCDENNDLVADAPTDPRKWKDPATLVFAYTPVEDPAVYQNVFKPF